MLSRLMKVFINPQDFWHDMITEPGDLRALLVPQMLILAGGAAFFVFLGTFMSQLGAAGFGRAFAAAIVSMILSFIFYLAAWVGFGYIIDRLAVNFGSQKDLQQSLKLATGAVIPVLAASVLQLTNVLLLSLLGTLAGLAYGGYVLYLGLPILNNTAPDKAIGYSAAATGIFLIIVINAMVFARCPASCFLRHM